MNISEIVRTLVDNDCKISRLSLRRFLRRFQERVIRNCPAVRPASRRYNPTAADFRRQPDGAEQ